MIEKKIDDISFVSGSWPLTPSKPTLVFLHGSGGSNVLWKNQIEALLPVANTVAPDFPGHGKSPGNAEKTIAAYASHLHRFIAALNPPEPVPCGLSIGGAIALQLLLDHKADYQSGILINTGARLKVLPMIFDGIEKDYNAFVEMTGQFAMSPKTDPAKVEPLIAAMRACSPESAYADFLACDAFNVMDRLQEIEARVLVLAAEDDNLTPPKYGAYLTANISNAEEGIIPAAGHLSPMENGAAVNAAIEAFIRKR